MDKPAHLGPRILTLLSTALGLAAATGSWPRDTGLPGRVGWELLAVFLAQALGAGAFWASRLAKRPWQRPLGWAALGPLAAVTVLGLPVAGGTLALAGILGLVVPGLLVQAAWGALAEAFRPTNGPTTGEPTG